MTYLDKNKTNMENVNKKNKMEIITITPILLGQCNHCEIVMNAFGANHTLRQEEEYPKEFIEQSRKLTSLVNSLSKSTDIQLAIYEAFTVKGLFKLLKFRNGKLPLIILNGKKISSGKINDVQNIVENTYRLMI